HPHTPTPPFDIILLDLSLPDSQGIDSFIKLRDRSQHIPIVVLTGLDDQKLALLAMQQGAQDYLIKGQVDRNLLLRSIRYAIERERAETALRQAKNELEQRVIERTRDLQQTENSLRDALQKVNFHFENSPLAAIEWDRDFRVSRWSATAEKIFGWSSAQVLGKRLGEWKFVVPEDAERIGQVMNRFISGEETSNVTINRNYCQDGTIVNCEWYNSVLLDDDGRMESVFSLALDVTHRQQVERMKDEFISVVSHELRTPMTSIYGSLKMLDSGLLNQQPEKEKRLLTIAVDSTDRLMRLVNDILDIERIESGTVPMVKSVCKVSDLMSQAVDVIQPLADKAGIELSVSDTGGNVWVDPDRMIQTFTNLLSNAIKFSPKDSTIWFTASKQAGQMLFQVRDRGRGIPADKLGMIFERFQQVDASDARSGEGTGLGLAICRSIIQQHGGQIWVESVLGEGSTFSCILARSPSTTDSCPPSCPL
ncbi:ATP-binding protein, partial [Chamaesiphon sp. VAR_48_metabat_135_sub]|uniref:hybrid sensor histidine kinase/response regulator n=1 Tax=Chamaesiphon sp. VAR_48_metabat_135_sub TaxID=2964699 RepID=UPI00286D2078